MPALNFELESTDLFAEGTAFELAGFSTVDASAGKSLSLYLGVSALVFELESTDLFALPLLAFVLTFSGIGSIFSTFFEVLSPPGLLL